jgi:predicted anti-sigma-YlaC factor YlaD
VTCPDTATDLGAYVLGALEPADRRRVEEHLERCPSCAAELAELAGLPAFLDRVDPADLTPAAVAPSPELFARMSAAATPPRRVRIRALVLVAAAVLAVLGLGVTVWVTGSPDQTVTASAGAVRAEVTVSPVENGSALHVTVAGMHPHETCRLVAVERDGTRHAAGQWPASAAGDGTWRSWTDVDRAHLAAVILVGDGDRELVRALF